MTVYLDTAFAVNGSVNYLLLLSAAYLAGAPLRRGRFLLAAALGGLYAAASFVPALAFLRTAGMKAVLLAVMALTAFGARRQTVKLALLFAANQRRAGRGRDAGRAAFAARSAAASGRRVLSAPRTGDSVFGRALLRTLSPDSLARYRSQRAARPAHAPHRHAHRACAPSRSRPCSTPATP